MRIINDEAKSLVELIITCYRTKHSGIRLWKHKKNERIISWNVNIVTTFKPLYIALHFIFSSLKQFEYTNNWILIWIIHNKFNFANPAK
jgi:ABC-type arginine/histidine transport system permease subunit